jgi:hypothetical protein
MNPFDQAWTVLKAVEFNPYADDIKEARPFKAYRSIPTKFLDEALSEGIQPRSVAPWNVGMAVPDMSSKRLRQLSGGPPDDWPESLKEHWVPESMEYPSDKGVWSFMHRRGALPNTKGQRQLRQDWPYGSTTHPALTARYFGDNYGNHAAMLAGTAEYRERAKPLEGLGSLVDDGREQVKENHSIVGSTIIPPGRRFRDVDWGSSAHNATQPILTTDPIPARYLDEAIPVDSEGNEISYTQGSTIPDRLRDEWGFN